MLMATKKPLGLLLISISEMAHSWREQADPVYTVSNSCDFIMSLTTLSASQTPKLLHLSFH